MERTLCIGVLSALVMCMGIVDAVPYSKYGRSCKDIGCRTNEVCVMETDPCTIYSRDQCGSYPTCKRSADSGGLSCTTKICPTGQYCKTVSGNPTCVNTSPDLEFDSAGVSSVNGHRADGDTNHGGATHTNVNPYSNANAPPPPPPPEVHGSNIRPVNTNFGLGYPPDPSNSGNYPPYSGTSSNNGQRSDTDRYGYPTQNRMPQQPGNYPPYNGGYPLYPTNQQPGYTNNQYPNYPYSNRNHNTRRPYNSANGCTSHITTLAFIICGFLLITKYLS